MASIRAATFKGFQDDRYRSLIQKLVEQRKHQGLTQEGLAQRIGLHQQFVSRFELGERRLDVVEFADIARALGLDPTDLMGSIPAKR